MQDKANYIKPGQSKVTVLKSDNSFVLPGIGTVQWLKEKDDGIFVCVVMDDESLPMSLKGKRVTQMVNIDNIALIPDGAIIEYDI